MDGGKGGQTLSLQERTGSNQRIKKKFPKIHVVKMFGRECVNRVNREIRSEIIKDGLSESMQNFTRLQDQILRIRASKFCEEHLTATLLRLFFATGASSVAVAVDRELGIWFLADAAVATDRSSLTSLCNDPSWSALDATFLATEAPHFITFKGGSGGGEDLSFRFDLDKDGLWGYRLPQWCKI